MQRDYTCRNTRYRAEKQEDCKKLGLHIGERDEGEHIHYLRVTGCRSFYDVAVKSVVRKESYSRGNRADRNTFYDKGCDYVCLCGSDEAH